MNALRALVAAVAMLLVAGGARSADSEIPLNAEQQAQYDNLIHQFRCLVCQNETIADSQADLAADLRNKVREHVAAGETDAQVKHYLTDRYGDFVLYNPPFSARNALLWLGPFLLLAVALGIAVRRARRKLPAAEAASAADPVALRKLLEEES